MKEPTFDKNGYPTNETLQAIRDWEISDGAGCLRFIVDAWYYPERVAEKDGLWVSSTGGWSGNEDLIEALHDSKVWWMLAWHSLSFPGGFLAIACSKEAEEALEKQIDGLVRWAWDKVRKSEV